jgi:hypothetical protein
MVMKKNVCFVLFLSCLIFSSQLAFLGNLKKKATLFYEKIKKYNKYIAVALTSASFLYAVKAGYINSILKSVFSKRKPLSISSLVKSKDGQEELTNLEIDYTQADLYEELRNKAEALRDSMTEKHFDKGDFDKKYKKLETDKQVADSIIVQLRNDKNLVDKILQGSFLAKMKIGYRAFRDSI